MMSVSPPAAWDAEDCRAVVRQFADLDGPLLPVLHALMGRFGCIDARAVAIIAEELNLSRADVHGVVTFYHDFRRQPAGRHVMKVCRAEACQAVGGGALYDDLAEACAGDDRVTVEPVYCLGNCALGPAALIDGDLVGRLDCRKALARVGR